MKPWKKFALGSLCLLVIWSCEKRAQPAANQAVVPSPATTQEDPKVEGYVVKTSVIGYPYKGLPNTEWEDFETTTYNPAGQEIAFVSHFDGMGTRRNTTYDSTGHIFLEITTTDGGHRVEHRHKWSGDFLKHTREEYDPHLQGIVATSTETFGPDGKRLATASEDNYIPDYPQKSSIEYRYDGRGYLVQELETAQDKTIPGTKYERDAAGNATKIERHDADGNLSQVEFFVYDGTGRKIERYFQDLSAFDKTKQLEARYTYDENGRLSKELHYKGECDAARVNKGKCTITTTIDYTYDDLGRLSMEIRTQAGTEFKEMKKRYEYVGEVPAALLPK
jgi:hypothetical protein